MELTDLQVTLKDQPEALELIQTLASKAAKNEELTTKAEASDKLKTDLEAVKKVNEDLISQRKTWKTDKENTVSKADFNKTVEEKSTLEERIKALETSNTSKEKEAADARLDSLTKDLRSSIVSVASTAKAINPNQVYLLMQGEGLIGMKEGKTFFNKLNEKNEPVTSTAEEATKQYLEKNKHLINPSGNVGAGATHTGAGDTTPKVHNNRAEARKAFLQGV